MKRNKERALIIFIKNPVKGKVKTRLAKTTGEEKALEIYTRLLEHTKHTALEVDAVRYLYYDRFVDNEDEWSDDEFTKLLQAEGDLGNRMSDAFQSILEKHNKVVIIGSDCPSIDATLLRKAFDLLNTHDCVIGPSFDGGYYLLGLKQMLPDLFADISWSTPEVFGQTTSRIKEAGLSFRALKMLRDIDTEEDYKASGLE